MAKPTCRGQILIELVVVMMFLTFLLAAGKKFIEDHGGGFESHKHTRRKIWR